MQTVYSTRDAIASAVRGADLLIGGVLVPGAAAPKLLSLEMVASMPPGAAIVDVAIDQGGCIATSRPTSHNNPIFTVHDVIHYCVPNMPGTVPRTSTIALTQETLPYAIEIASKGFVAAVKENRALAKGVNVYKGKITYQRLSEVVKEEFVDLKNLL